MIIISDRTVALWMLKIDEGHDFLMHLEESGPGKFRVLSRFRTYAGPDSDLFDGDDSKQWIGADIESTRSEALARCRFVFEGMRETFGREADELLYENNKQFMSLMASKHWAHFRVTPLEDTHDS